MPKNAPPKQKPHPASRVDPAARHHARWLALQAMYQWQMADTPLLEIEQTFLKRHDKQIFDKAYFKQLLHEVPHHQAAIEASITPHLLRSIHHIDPIELAVLRIATYELLYCPDIPFRVVINEALQLTKQFGSIEGYKFVNSIIDKIARSSRK